MTETFDVVICGAGPAGCSAAITLANHGVKVLLFDKSKFPREKPCGGLLTEKTYQIITNTLGLEKIDSVIQYRSNGFEIYDTDEYVNSAITEESTYYVHRRDFDNFLFESAKEAGCLVLTNTEIEAQDINKIKMKGKWYKYGYLLGADGVHSSVRRLANMSHSNKNIAFGLQVDVPLKSWRPESDWENPKIFFGYVKYGWGWIFPKGDHLSIGLAGLFESPKMTRDVFHRFLKDLSCFDHSKDNQVRGAWVPYGSYTRNPCKGNVFLLGDAAGFVDPITGEGIYFAMLSGNCAATAIIEDINSDAPRRYQRLCNSTIIKPLRQALLARWFLFEEPFHAYAMKRFMGNTKHLKLFLKVLSGTVDYKGYFTETIKRKSAHRK